MFARITNFVVKPEFNSDETWARLERELTDKLRAIPGIRQTMHLAGRDDCRCMVIAVYGSEEDAEASADTVRAIWADYQHMLAAPPEPEGYEVKIHVQA